MHQAERSTRRVEGLATAVMGLALVWLILGTSGSASAQPASTRPATWTAQSMPGTATKMTMTAVSCSSARFCLAVGNDYRNDTVISEVWDGTVWRSVPMADPTHPSSRYFFNVNAVSCVSRTACVAVGSVTGRLAFHTLAEVWNGRRWRTTTPVFAGNAPELSGVSCVSAGDCIAVGSFTNPSATEGSALAERWNGVTWKRILRSRPTAPLVAVSCPSASLCFAGSWQLSGLERWNGSRWTLVERDAVSAEVLSCSSTRSCLALACPKATACQETGPTNSYGWNGSIWRRITTHGAKRQSRLTSLACVSATSCTAVGDVTGGSATVAARWNGRYWTLRRDPGGVSGLQLAAVSCAGPACEAVGYEPVPHRYPEPVAVGSR